MVKFLKWFFIVLAVLILACAGYFVFSVTKFRNGEVLDLGVKYSYKDYTEAVEGKAQVSVKNPSALYLGSTFQTSGSKHVEQDFTNTEISAIQNYSNDKSGPFRDIQIAFHSDGSVEASGMVVDTRINAPIYAKGTINRTGDRSFEIKTSTIIAGQYVLPSALRKIVDDKFGAYINSILKNIDGLKVEKIEFKDGAVNFVGDVPAKIF